MRCAGQVPGVSLGRSSPGSPGQPRDSLPCHLHVHLSKVSTQILSAFPLWRRSAFTYLPPFLGVRFSAPSYQVAPSVLLTSNNPQPLFRNAFPLLPAETHCLRDKKHQACTTSSERGSFQFISPSPPSVYKPFPGANCRSFHCLPKAVQPGPNTSFWACSSPACC